MVGTVGGQLRAWHGRVPPGCYANELIAARRVQPPRGYRELQADPDLQQPIAQDAVPLAN